MEIDNCEINGCLDIFILKYSLYLIDEFTHDDSHDCNTMNFRHNMHVNRDIIGIG